MDVLIISVITGIQIKHVDAKKMLANNLIYDIISSALHQRDVPVLNL